MWAIEMRQRGAELLYIFMFVFVSHGDMQNIHSLFIVSFILINIKIFSKKKKKKKKKLI